MQARHVAAISNEHPAFELSLRNISFHKPVRPLGLAFHYSDDLSEDLISTDIHSLHQDEPLCRVKSLSEHSSYLVACLFLQNRPTDLLLTEI